MEYWEESMNTFRNGDKVYTVADIERLEQQLEKANERVALLERVEKIFNESPELTFGDVKSVFSDELNQFAIEQQIEALESVREYAISQYPNGAIHSISDRIEQLRKKQDNV